MAVEIDAERVLRDLYGLRKIGAFKTGVHRPTLSADDMTTRRWLADELRHFVGLNPEFEVPVERLATFLARLDDEDE